MFCLLCFLFTFIHCMLRLQLFNNSPVDYRWLLALWRTPCAAFPASVLPPSAVHLRQRGMPHRPGTPPSPWVPTDSSVDSWKNKEKFQWRHSWFLKLQRTSTCEADLNALENQRLLEKIHQLLFIYYGYFIVV